MAKAFVVSDIHSFYNEMIEALNNAGFDKNNPEHIFISLGDLCDRGPDAIKCLSFVNKLPNDRKILIRGNHEDLMQEAIKRGYFCAHDYHNKTADTVYQVTGIYPDTISADADSIALEDMKYNNLWTIYYNSTIDYYESGHYIFVHGWIPFIYDSQRLFANSNSTGNRLPPIAYNTKWRESSLVDWEEARWVNGMQAWDCGVKESGKTIYCGHWHTSWGHTYLHHKGTEWPDEFARICIQSGLLSEDANIMHSEPFIDKGIVAMDACTTISGKVNCKVIGNFRRLTY